MSDHWSLWKLTNPLAGMVSSAGAGILPRPPASAVIPPSLPMTVGVGNQSYGLTSPDLSSVRSTGSEAGSRLYGFFSA
jgi:hypothetical protein